MTSGFTDVSRLSVPEAAVANRITKLAQIVATGMNNEFQVTIFKRDEKPTVQTATGMALASTEQVLIMLMRLDEQLANALKEAA